MPFRSCSALVQKGRVAEEDGVRGGQWGIQRVPEGGGRRKKALRAKALKAFLRPGESHGQQLTSQEWLCTLPPTTPNTMFD